MKVTLATLSVLMALVSGRRHSRFHAKVVDSPEITDSFFSSAGDDVAEWLAQEAALGSGIAYTGLLANINPPGTVKGVVIASPSNKVNETDNDYFYHWKRDSALTMDVVNMWFERGQKDLESLMWDYASFSTHLQGLNVEGGIAEPKFRVDGSAFRDGWCRPQTDGPALEASTLMRFAKAYLAKGGSLEKVKSLLYDGKYPADTVIKTNLEFVSGNWENINTCDLWEERRGDFFYTRMVQRRAMIEGAAFAKQLGDAGAGEWYVKQAEKLSKALEVHWSENRGFIVSGYEGNNLQPIRSGLDIATILAVIQSDTGDSLTFSLTDDRVLATLKPLVESFRAIYRINAITQDDQGRPLGLAIGRYFEDSYDGVRNSRGNPWYLTTAAVAEYLYKVSSAFKAKGVIPVTQRSVSFFRDILGLTQVFPGAVYTRGDAMYDSIHTQLKAVGDSYIRRIMFHSRSGRLPEEYTRDEGKERGAKDLTWSYAAIWTAADARAQLA